MARFLCLAALAATLSSTACAISPSLVPVGSDGLLLTSGFVNVLFNLTRGSLDVLQGRFLGDGDFSSSPNLAGGQGAPANVRRGGLSVISWGLGMDASTSSFDRSTPLSYTVLSNDTNSAGFCVTMTDSPTSPPRLTATLCLGLDSSNPRGLAVNLTSATTNSAFNPSLVSLSTSFTPVDSVIWYENRGVRQGMLMSQGYISSPVGNNVSRYYAIGNVSTGAVEILCSDHVTSTAQSYIFAGANGAYSTATGFGLALFGTAATPVDSWQGSYDKGNVVPLQAGLQASPLSLTLYPNDYSFPPSTIPVTLPAKVDVQDLRSILTAVHGSPVSALHSYDFTPEVRAAPCPVVKDGQCYSPLYNFYDPDSGISNSAMAYSFDPMVQEQVRGQLETNMAHVCAPTDPSSLCVPGQCIHHFVGDCNGAGPECRCTTMPSGVQDCVVYDAISGAVQTGPNAFTVMAALRYAGTTGNIAWLQAQMPTLRAMMGFLESAFDNKVGLYNVPGSLQIDVFIRNNYTADSNAFIIILSELFAEAEAGIGNATGAAFYQQRAATLRSAMNQYLTAASGDHYCTQSNALPGGGVDICARDFVDYDANVIAVAAGVPPTLTAANKILARVDSGQCTHIRATYVSEILYNASNCVNGNTGDSAVTMGRIGWQDALARKAVGDAATFSNILLAPLQADLLRRTWMPERFDCKGNDAHSLIYFEYPAVVALMLYEVKYGISLEIATVRVNPLVAKDFDFALGGFHVGYYNGGTSFHATLPANFAGNRTFVIGGVQEGAWTVTPSSGSPFPATVGADGVLTFNVAVGGGLFVDAVAGAV